MRKTRSRSRNATVTEIEARLRTMGDHLGDMIKREADASDASTGTSVDLESHSEASRRFDQSLQSFLSAARTCWNYLIQATNHSGTRAWLDQRTSGNLYLFHRELANLDLHDYQVTPGVNQTVKWQADANVPWIQTSAGRMPAKMTVTGVAGVSFVHNPNNLNPELAQILESVSRKYGTKSIVALATRYYDGLAQIVRSGRNRGSFEVKASE